MANSNQVQFVVTARTIVVDSNLGSKGLPRLSYTNRRMADTVCNNKSKELFDAAFKTDTVNGTKDGKIHYHKCYEIATSANPVNSDVTLQLLGGEWRRWGKICVPRWI